MKKKIVFTLLIAIVGLFVFTGCQKDEPYSIYQIAATFSGITYGKLPKKEIEALPPSAEKDKSLVAICLASYLTGNRFIMNGTYGNPIIIEGDNEEYNDDQAIRTYRNKVVVLDEKDLKQVIIDAQKKMGADGEPELILTTSGSITFNYAMWKTSKVVLMTECQQSYTVAYDPLPVTPNP